MVVSLKYKKPVKKQVTFMMDEEYYRKLQKIADADRTSRSELMRRILIDYVNKEQDMKGRIF